MAKKPATEAAEQVLVKVYIPKDAHRLLRMASFEYDLTLAEVITQLARENLKRYDAPGALSVRERVISEPNAPASESKTTRRKGRAKR